MELEISEFELKPVLIHCLTMIKEKALMHRITLSLEAEEHLDVIEADERKLKQVLYNLLSNAAKFTPDGGRITLEARFENGAGAPAIEEGASRNPMEGPLEAPEAVPTERIRISVRDTGIGIRKEDLEQIFDSFKQVDGSASREYQGTGLGLALTRRFVDLHHGWIWAESPGEGRGSAFNIVIPIRHSAWEELKQKGQA